MHNPELAAFAWEERRAEARALQAGLPPNPELETELEEFGGSKEFEGSQSLETTLQLSQLIELAGKRAKRRRVAELGRELSGWDYESKRLDVLTEVASSFIAVVAAQERLAATSELLRLARQIHDAVAARVEAGAVSPIEQRRAEVTLVTSQSQLEAAQRELLASRHRLVATWGSSKALFGRAEGELFALTPIPELDPLRELLDQNPDVARWEAEIEERLARLDLESANAVPDLTLSGGVKRLDATNDRAFVFGFSLPLPVFNRNQGSIAEARFDVAKADEERIAAVARAASELATEYESLAAAHLEAIALRERALPAAESAFEATREGYAEGKFSLLEMLDIQRTLFDLRLSYIEALERRQRSAVRVERFIGQPFNEIPPHEDIEGIKP
jgi:cobalt-zinc-cadmium efflux system outer membrane protein